MAIVAEGDRGGFILAPTREHETVAQNGIPDVEARNELCWQVPRWFSPPLYGMNYLRRPLHRPPVGGADHLLRPGERSPRTHPPRRGRRRVAGRWRSPARGRHRGDCVCRGGGCVFGVCVTGPNDNTVQSCSWQSVERQSRPRFCPTGIPMDVGLCRSERFSNSTGIGWLRLMGGKGSSNSPIRWTQSGMAISS